MEVYDKSYLKSPTRASVLEHVSRPIFLHFFDRELQTTLGIYTTLPESLVNEDFRLLLLSTYEDAYMSAAQVFENRFARSIFWQLLPLFQKGHIQGVMGTSGLRDFMLSKREQYSYVKELYPFYFDDTWQHIAEHGPVYRHKEKDTTTTIAGKLITDLQTDGSISSARRLGIVVDQKEVDKALPHIIEALELRGKRAITKLLFTHPYKKLDSSFTTRRIFDIKVSENYVSAYLEEYDGTIVTGLSSGIEYFHYLCPTFPFHHLPLWRQVNYRLGCLSIIRSMTAEEIVMIREASEFQNFIDEFRYFIARGIQTYYLLHSLSISDHLSITQYLERTIRINLYPLSAVLQGADNYLRVLEHATIMLRSLDLDRTITTAHQRRLQEPVSLPTEATRTILNTEIPLALPLALKVNEGKTISQNINEIQLKITRKPVDRINIYISSAPAPEDEALLDELIKQLSMLKRQYFTYFWDKRHVIAGTNRKLEISSYLNQAHLILLLVSPDFLASDECYEEMEFAAERMEAGNAHVIPILIRHSAGWQNTPIGNLQTLPIDQEPISSRVDKEKSIYDSAVYIQQIIEKMYYDPLPE